MDLVVDSECVEAMAAHEEDTAVATAAEVDTVALLAGSRIAAAGVAVTSGDHEVAMAAVGDMDVDGEEIVVEDMVVVVLREVHSGEAMAINREEDTVQEEVPQGVMAAELTVADEEDLQEDTVVEVISKVEVTVLRTTVTDQIKVEDGDRSAAVVEVATAGEVRAGTLIELEKLLTVQKSTEP